MKNELTVEDLIEKTLGHLAFQGKNSIGPKYPNGHEQCLYRNPEGLKCAVGFWIPDGLYVDDLEGNSVEDIQYALDPQYNWTDELVSILYDLQGLHDTNFIWASPETLHAAIYSFALAKNLRSIITPDGFIMYTTSEMLDYIKMNWKGKLSYAMIYS